MTLNESVEVEGPSLPVLSSKRFPHAQPIKFPFTAYCSPHDLLAIVTTNNDISVFRITSGQVAFTVKRENAAKKGIEVTVISWKADGMCLGVGWSDGKYGVYDGGNGKQLALTELEHEDVELGWRLALLKPDEDEGEEDQRKKNDAAADADADEEEELDAKVYPRAEVMGWMGYFGVGGVKGEKKGPLTTEDWLDELDEGIGNFSISAKTPGPKLAQLSRAITTLDVTKALPRLSAVQNHITKASKGMGKTQKVASVWQTQQGTDSIFEVGKDLTAKDTVESFLVCQDDGTTQVLIDETVRVGSCNITGKPLSHAAHPNSSSHAILSQTEDGAYHLNTLDLPLSTLSGPLLHVIATNTKRIQTLLDYVVQTIRCIQYDYNHNVEVSTRFLRSLSGFVEGTDLSDLRANFYHLAMTGTFPDQLLEWLKDVLQDRGQKRWEEHMNDMYRHIQDHLFINLLPALDRFSIAVTTLRGHATFYEGSTKFDCPSELFTKVIDQIDCLRLVTQKMLLIVQTEHRQARAFNKWMKMQMEVAGAEPFTTGALETESREVPSLDYSLVLAYIRDVMTESRLAVHIQNRPGMEGQVSAEDFWNNDIIRGMSYEHCKEVLQREHDPGRPMSLSLRDVPDQTALLNLPAIACVLQGRVRVVLGKITQWQSRMLSEPIQSPLAIDPQSEAHDMVMTSDGTTKLLLSHPLDSNQLTLLTSRPSSPSPSSTTTTILPLPPSTALLSAVWIAHTHGTHFLTLAQTTTTTTDSDGEHETSHTSLRRHTISALAGAPASAETTLHTFPHDGGGDDGVPFRPEAMVVGGRAGRMLCVVFGNQGREWRVLDLDGGERRRREEGGAGEGGAGGEGGMEIDGF